MKTILAATDFSKVSTQAVTYAAEMAIQTGAKLVLFHVYHPPVIASDVVVPLPSLEEMKKDSLKYLKKLSTKLVTQLGPGLQVSCQTACGLAVDEIRSYVKKHGVDLVVIGMQGAGYLSQKFIGSVTTSLIKKAKFPVLVIHKDSIFKRPKKIALACDYQEVKNQHVLKPLKELAGLFKSHIHLVNVLNKVDTRPTIEEAVACVKLEHAVEEVPHSFHYVKDSDVVEGINTFIRVNKSDLLVMIPRKHSLLKNIIKQPTTSRMAFNCSIPLLTLHE